MANGRRDVLVTGAGVVSALGIGREAFWSAWTEGRIPPVTMPSGPDGLPAPGPAWTPESAGFRAEALVEEKVLRRVSGLTRLAVPAAALALSDARIGTASPRRENAAVTLGTAFGSASYHFEYYEAIFRRGLKEASPLLFSESVMNAASGHISLHEKLRGPSLTVVGGEDVGAAAIATALDQIRAGSVDLALAGGAEEYCAMIHRAQAKVGIAARSMNPDDPETGDDRDEGLPYSSGAVLLTLEAVESVRLEQKQALVRLAGAGRARGARDDLENGEAVARATIAAFEDAGPSSCRDLVILTGSPDGKREWEGVLRGLPEGLSMARVSAIECLGEGYGYSSAALALVATQMVATKAASRVLCVIATRYGGATALVLDQSPRL